jgi:hypothetical protein
MTEIITGPSGYFAQQQQQPDLVGNLSHLLALKQQQQLAPLQLQQAQQNVQAGQLENQQRQTQLNDQQAMTKAMQQWDGKDLNGLAPLVVKNGGSAQAVMGLKSKALEMQKQYSDIAKQDAETGGSQLSNLMKKNDIVSGGFSSVLQQPDENLSQAIVATAQQLAQQGVLDPQHVQMANQIAQQPPAQARLALETMRKGMLADSQLLDQAQKQAATAKDTAQAGQANAAAAKDQAEMQFGTGAMADGRYRNILMNQKLGRPISPEDQAWAAAYKTQKTLNPVASFNLQNGGMGGGNGQPNAMAAAVANGQMKLSDVISPRTPMSVKQQFISEVQKINPNFDSSTYAIETKAAEKATSGQWADTRLAYNTALDHSQLLMQAAQALQNGNVQALNSLKNKFGTAFGSTGPITFNAIANAYNHEVTSVVAKGHMTDKEVETGGASLPGNASLPQIQSVVGAYNSLMKSKRDELDKIIKAGAGNKANGVLNTQSDSGGGQSSSSPVKITLPSGKTIQID